jgi:hypothetical protein
VVKLPSGVFRPYAGVCTAILCFTRTTSGGTDSAWARARLYSFPGLARIDLEPLHSTRSEAVTILRFRVRK